MQRTEAIHPARKHQNFHEGLEEKIWMNPLPKKAGCGSLPFAALPLPTSLLVHVHTRVRCCTWLVAPVKLSQAQLSLIKGKCEQAGQCLCSQACCHFPLLHYFTSTLNISFWVQTHANNVYQYWEVKQIHWKGPDDKSWEKQEKSISWNHAETKSPCLHDFIKNAQSFLYLNKCVFSRTLAL